jgi:hypothetical protein
LHRLPSLNGVVPQHPPPSHRFWWAGRNVAVGPDGYPLRVDRRRIGLKVTELLLLLGVQPPFTTSLFLRLVKAAVLVEQASITQKGMPFMGRRDINLTLKKRYFFTPLANNSHKLKKLS